MYFPFECKNCKKDKWSIRYDSESKVHIITCANCGVVEIIEQIFGSRRKKENVKKKDYRTKINEQANTHDEHTEPVTKDGKPV